MFYSYNNLKSIRNDIILILILLLVSFGIIFSHKHISNKGDAIIVRFDDIQYMIPMNDLGYYCIGYRDAGDTADLFEISECFESEQSAIEYSSSFSDYNILKVSENGVSVIQASCPDKICVKTHIAEKEGDMIVCLPNRLTMIVKSSLNTDSRKGDIDAVTW